MADDEIKKMRRAELEAELERLRRHQHLFNQTEAHAHIGHFELNLSRRRFESCSETFAQLFGLKQKAVLAPRAGFKKVLDRIHPQDHAEFNALFDQNLEDVVFDFEFRVLGDSGEMRSFYQIALSHYENDAGDFIFSGMVQDLSAFLKAEAEFEYKESLALQAEQISEIGNFIFEENEERYVYASPGCARIHGVSEEDFLHSVDSEEDDLEDVYEPDRERVEKSYKDYWYSGKDCKIEYRIILEDGEIRWIRELLVAIEMKDGKVSLTRGVIQDITEQKNTEMELREARDTLEQQVAMRTRELADTVQQLQTEIDERKKISAELEFLANHDPLTGLPSLRLCMDRLERTLAEARRSGRLAAVMFLDLDGFKQVNDSCGHEAGDDVLKITANRIKAEVRETDTVARIGGDEFLVILSDLPDLSVAQRVAANLLQQVAQPIQVNQSEVIIGTSIGVAIYPEDARDGEELIRIADQAMYSVKQGGKNSFGFNRPQKLN